MGFSFKAAQWALSQSCNSVDHALTLLQEHPELLPKSCVVTKNMIEEVWFTLWFTLW